MPIYTVHEPPLRAADALAEPERFAFVRDGFYWWAFLLTPLWMLRHRLWLVFVLYVILSVVIDIALGVLGASSALIALVGILISLLVGLEAGTLRRFTFRRRGWRNVGLVSGADLEDAERRFFGAWLREGSVRSGASSAPPRSPAATTAQSRPEASGVVGLFPEPGAQR